ncbi:ankyrin repeat-containing protein At5g02620-like isoform X1 [Quercus lobata]|uniref:ankyrin repeat-containing protein At5g02620-like isoform X1 n=1 Tax=Quercus lobata TaxID=97700 RepID=UPI001243FF00|nr:ankyrin repeat-containing protein At5g02620-like isoform X1 [Quercus lobata]XP_030942848.1 ankyrin repeat-containing protein At5g02620-like isoform X1 [Quercus lobata]
MSHSQTVSAGEDMVMERKGSPNEPGEVEETDEVEETNRHCASETQNQRQTKRQKRFQYLNSCVLLYQASFKGNWQAAKDLLRLYPGMVRDPITEGGDTALHIAAAANHPNFVKELLKLMKKEELEITNKYGQTALYFAAASGNVIIAEEMVEKNDKLTLIRIKSREKKFTPLYVAALLGRREMVSFLFDKTPFKDLSCGRRGERFDLLVATISNDWYDIALRIMQKDKRLATAKHINGKTALYELARKSFAIGSKSQLSLPKRCLDSWFKGIYKKDLMKTLARQLVEDLWREVRLLHGKQFSDHVKTFLFEAAKMGNAELLIIAIRSYPDLIWRKDAEGRSIFHIAVLYRQETVFNLIYEIGVIKDMILTYIDGENQNILHLAGKLAPPSRLNMVSGAALQMQRELLWFEEVEKIVLPSTVEMKDEEGKMPWDLFTETHNDLKTRGERWMKDTANYCMVVATLIATVVFAAAFTVPGGNKGDTGIPVFSKSKWFVVFFISDAVALLCSSTSILMFLSILTSRFAEKDFLYAPGKLVFGLTALFMSIGGMVAAFSATCILVYEREISWLPLVIIASAGFPVALFILLHRQLVVDAIYSCWSGLLLGPSKSKFFFFGRKRRLF